VITGQKETAAINRQMLGLYADGKKPATVEMLKDGTLVITAQPKPQP
jgi:hypothetical protein